MIAVSSVCGLLALGFAVQPPHIADAQIPVPIESTTDEPVRVAVAAPVQQPAPPPAPSRELLFVFTAGDGTYVKLGDGAEQEHGPRRMVATEGVTETVADVTTAKMPAKFRSMLGKELLVDASCRAKVTGFAVVTRLIGTPAYAGIEAEEWTVDTAANAGTSVLAARIDDCHAGTYARDATVAPIVAFELVEDRKLVEAARSAFLATDTARAADAAWLAERKREAANGTATATTGLWLDHVSATTKVMRHPTTGVTWVAIHAGGKGMCGGLEINVWGLFRVGANGALETVHALEISTLYSVDHLIDIDNDGTPELLGNDSLGIDRVLTRADGAQLDRLAVQFHGCGC